MAGVLRAGIDVAGGTILTGSPTVLVNGAPAVRIGDVVAAHGLPPHSPAPVMTTGSATVLVNGIPLCRTGDIASCGDAGAPGSATVLAA